MIFQNTIFQTVNFSLGIEMSSYQQEREHLNTWLFNIKLQLWTLQAQSSWLKKFIVQEFMVEEFMIEEFMVEKVMVDEFMVEDYMVCNVQGCS